MAISPTYKAVTTEWIQMYPGLDGAQNDTDLYDLYLLHIHNFIWVHMLSAPDMTLNATISY